jgi:large subunit ribosomal protein L29
MKAEKPNKVRDLKAGEIETKLSEARHELMNLRFQQVTGQLSDPSRVRVLRRNIARMLTILREQKETQLVVEGEA